jgi:hypothetical protein
MRADEVIENDALLRCVSLLLTPLTTFDRPSGPFFCCRRAMGEALTRHSLRPLCSRRDKRRRTARANHAARVLSSVLSAVMPRACGASSIPEASRLSTAVAGTLDRPVEPGDNVEKLLDTCIEA